MKKRPPLAVLRTVLLTHRGSASWHSLRAAIDFVRLLPAGNKPLPPLQHRTLSRCPSFMGSIHVSHRSLLEIANE
jgi:hypothetical protein